MQHFQDSNPGEKGTNELDSLLERVADNLVLDDTDDVRRRLGRRLEHSVDGLNTLERRQNPIKSARHSSPLRVSERSHSGVEPEPVGEDVLDVVGLDGLEVPVERTLSNDDDRLSLAHVSVLGRGAVLVSLWTR